MVSSFDLTFGKLPFNFLSRDNLVNEICFDFCSENPNSNLYVISGARGSGKTVLLNKIYKGMMDIEDWVVIKVNPDRDILEQIAANIYENENVKHLFVKKSFSFSFHCVSFSIEGKTPVSNIKTLVKKMFNYLKKENKKILVCMDEATNSKEMKAFAHDFQEFIGDGYDIFLLMTGLYENIVSLQNNKSLTFLYRAPKIYLEPLDLNDIFASYLKIFKDKTREEIKDLTKLTKGYAYAYQLLGYLYTNIGAINKELIEKFDASLKDYCYDKIYENIPENELKILRAIPKEGSCSSRYIVDNSGFNIKNISVYKDRLIKRGILRDKKGIFDIILPRFKEFLDEKLEFDF